MKEQQEIVRMFFRAREPVRFKDEGRKHLGYVQCEVKNRPGWYYIRSLENRVHLVMWSDIEGIPTGCPVHPDAVGRVEGCIGCA